MPRTQIFLHSSYLLYLSVCSFICICFHSDDHDFSYDAGRYLRSVSSEVAEETNQSTEVSAQVKHMMSAEVDEVLHD